MRSYSCSLTIAKAVKNVLNCRAGNQCIFNYNLLSLLLILLNISGSRAYNMSDFPYPVGKDTKVSRTLIIQYPSWVDPGEGELQGLQQPSETIVMMT